MQAHVDVKWKLRFSPPLSVDAQLFLCGRIDSNKPNSPTKWFSRIFNTPFTAMLLEQEMQIQGI